MINNLCKHEDRQLRLALEAVHVGIWDWNILTNGITWSNTHEELFGLEPGTFEGTYEAFEACVHPMDREGIAQAVNRARQERQNYRHEFRVVWVDGSIHWIEGKGRFFYDETDQAVRMIGTVVDVSDRTQAQKSLNARLQQQAAVAKLLEFRLRHEK